MSESLISVGSAESYLDACVSTLTRSHVVAWLTSNYERLLAATQRRTLDWSILANCLAREGVQTRHGRAPTAGGLRVEWYRVKRRIAAANTEAAAIAARLEAEREAALEASRAKKRHEAEDAEALKIRVEQTERAATWQRQRAARSAPYLQEATAQLRARQAAQDLPVSAPTATSTTGEPTGSTENRDAPGLVTLDLPRFSPPYVSTRAYLPMDPSLPPVREGEVCAATGIKWEFGDDLPGYPSKRNYEYELDWLRDVGRLLRARHPTNVTMTHEERYIIRTAKSRIPNLL